MNTSGPLYSGEIDLCSFV